MITQKTKYALKALMTLAEEATGEGGALTIEEIARRSGAPKRFLEHILLELRNVGIHRIEARPLRRLHSDQGAEDHLAR